MAWYWARTTGSAVPPPEDPVVLSQYQAIREQLDQVNALVKIGKYPPAQLITEECLVKARALPYRVAAGQVLVRLGGLQNANGKYAEAVKTLREARRIALQEKDAQTALAAALEEMWVTGVQLAKTDEGLRLVSIVEMGLALTQNDRRVQGQLLSRMGAIYFQKAEYQQAMEYMKKAMKLSKEDLGPDHLSLANDHNSIGSVHFQKGEHDQALAQFEKAMTIKEKTLGPEHPDVALSHNNIGMAMRHLKALAIWTKALGPNHPHVAECYNNLGLVFSEQDDYDQALEYHRLALALRIKVLGPKHPRVAHSQSNIGAVLSAQAQYDRALPHFMQALEIWVENLGPEHKRVATLQVSVADVLSLQGKFEAAAEHYQKAKEIYEKSPDPQDSDIVWPLCGLASADVVKGKGQSARQIFERVLSICAQDKCKDDNQDPLARSRFALARILWQHQPSRARAIELGRQSLTYFETQQSVTGLNHRKEVEDWLVSHRLADR